jgi:hypothetical protein
MESSKTPSTLLDFLLQNESNKMNPWYEYIRTETDKNQCHIIISCPVDFLARRRHLQKRLTHTYSNNENKSNIPPSSVVHQENTVQSKQIKFLTHMLYFRQMKYTDRL